MGALDRQKDDRGGPRANSASSIAGGTCDKTGAALLLRAHQGKAGLFGKGSDEGKPEGSSSSRPNRRRRDSPREAVGRVHRSRAGL